jgi:hypothetical protein
VEDGVAVVAVETITRGLHVVVSDHVRAEHSVLYGKSGLIAEHKQAARRAHALENRRANPGFVRQMWRSHDYLDIAKPYIRASRNL